MINREKALLKWLQMNEKFKFSKLWDNAIEGENYCPESLIAKARKEIFKAKKPKSRIKTNYVGIEVEAFSTCDKSKLIAAFYRAKLQDKVSIGNDGSIHPLGEAVGHEIRIMDTEKNIGATIQKVFKILKRFKFQVNHSCGLHVHVDCRNRVKEDVYVKLLNTQVLLYGLVDLNRMRNLYCKFSTELTKMDKYRAINYNQRGKTVEIRLHEGTMDGAKVCAWVDLILRIVNHKAPVLVQTLETFKSRIGSTKKISRYLNSNYVPRTRGVDFDVT